MDKVSLLLPIRLIHTYPRGLGPVHAWDIELQLKLISMDLLTISDRYD